MEVFQIIVFVYFNMVSQLRTKIDNEFTKFYLEFLFPVFCVLFSFGSNFEVMIDL